MFHYDGKVFLARYSYTRKNMGFGNVEADSEWNSKLLIVEPESGEDIVLIDETQTGYFYDIRPLTRSKMNSQELYLAFYLHDYTLQRLGLEKVYQFEEESNTIIEVDKERSYSTLLGTIDGKEYHRVEGQGILCDDQVIIADDRVLLQGGMFQDKYLYITDGWCDEKKDGMAIYDLQGNLIGKIFEENCTEYNIAEILGYSDEHIFFRINHAAPMANEGVYETYAIDAQALAKGELKYTLFYEQYWIND